MALKGQGVPRLGGSRSMRGRESDTREQGISSSGESRAAGSDTREQEHPAVGRAGQLWAVEALLGLLRAQGLLWGGQWCRWQHIPAGIPVCSSPRVGLFHHSQGSPSAFITVPAMPSIFKEVTSAHFQSSLVHRAAPAQCSPALKTSTPFSWGWI